MYKDCKRVKDSLEWWQLISEKRCDGYGHLQEYYVYNETPKVFYHKENPKP